MTEQFEVYEKLYRAVFPPDIMPMFWKENGEISSAVFKDKNGLSVERAGDRDESDVIADMRIYFYGAIIGVLVGDCLNCGAVLKYLPTQRSIFHSEIHGSQERKLLSQSQCKYLAKAARIYYTLAK
ncbi:MAG: hypothetical protein J5824_01890 [Lachnospiraceae bacterium]|nr:hypothetical protein [Lachnospiraceae bacterium]